MDVPLRVASAVLRGRAIPGGTDFKHGSLGPFLEYSPNRVLVAILIWEVRTPSNAYIGLTFRY